MRHCQLPSTTRTRSPLLPPPPSRSPSPLAVPLAQSCGCCEQKPIEFRLDAVANALQWPVSDLQYQLFRLQDTGDVTLRFDEWSFVVRVHPSPDGGARDVDAVTTPLYTHMAQLETTQCVGCNACGAGGAPAMCVVRA